MGRSSFRVRVRTAAEQFKARLAASPDIWDELAGADPAGQVDDVSAWLALPSDFSAPDEDGAAYRRGSLPEPGLTDDGSESMAPDPWEWDDQGETIRFLTRDPGEP